MKTSSLLRTAAVAAILLALVVFGLPLFSHLYYGRSQAATLFAWQLEKDEFFSDYSFAEYLNEQRIANSAPYELPEDELVDSGTGDTNDSIPSIWSSPVASLFMTQFMLSVISAISY